MKNCFFSFSFLWIIFFRLNFFFFWINMISQLLKLWTNYAQCIYWHSSDCILTFECIVYIGVLSNIFNVYHQFSFGVCNSLSNDTKRNKNIISVFVFLFENCDRFMFLELNWKKKTLKNADFIDDVWLVYFAARNHISVLQLLCLFPW